MGTSNAYSFQNITVDRVINDAYQRIGMLNAYQNGIYYKAARTSGNFLLSSWVNEGLNLFTIDQNIIPIVNGITSYALPANTSKILDCKLSNSNRKLNGTPYTSAGGNPAAAFDGNINTNCTQTSANGSLGYVFSSGTPINYIGVLVGNTTPVESYKLALECSYLNANTGLQDEDWITIQQTPLQTYYWGETTWFALPYTKNALSWRIRETNGAILNIAELYFNIPFKSVPMNPIGRDQYFGYPTNSQSGNPTLYWVNRINPPVFNVWPMPVTGDYDMFVYNRVRYIQDLGAYINDIDTIPAFLEALTAGLAVKLAEKFKPELLPDLRQAADVAYLKAGRENTENVNLQVTWANDNQ